MSERPARPLFIVSDGTGDTADRVTRAALRQFEGFRVAVHVFSNVTDSEHPKVELLSPTQVPLDLPANKQGIASGWL